MKSRNASLANLKEPYRSQAVAQINAQNAGRIIATDRPSKYKNQKTPFRSSQGFELVAASKKEARDYAMLDLWLKAGAIRAWVPQVGFKLQGGSRYVCDSMVIWADGHITLRDVKGHETPSFKIKRGLLRSTYGLEVELI